MFYRLTNKLSSGANNEKDLIMDMNETFILRGEEIAY